MTAEPLSQAEIAVVQRTFDLTWSSASRMNTMFYDRLFEIAPETRSMFAKDLTHQKHVFGVTLATIVGSLDNLGGLLSSAGRLARNHVGYGVRPHHYALVGEALLWSLAQGLGAQWTADVAATWKKAYAFVSITMMSAAYDSSAHSLDVPRL